MTERSGPSSCGCLEEVMLSRNPTAPPSLWQTSMPKSTNPFAARRKASASASPFSTLQRTKSSLSRSNSKAGEDDYSRLGDTGFVPSLVPFKVYQDVVTLIRHIQNTTFSELPDRAPGMNSTRISEVYLFRSTLPPVVSLAHLMAISKSTTASERELARLVADGTIRRVTVPGRGKGGAAVGEGVVVVEDWRRRVLDNEQLSDDTKEKYLQLIGQNTASKTTNVAGLNAEEIAKLVQAGFLTSPSALSLDRSDSFDRPVAGSGALSSAGSKAATGTLAAVGGYGAIYSNGGVMTSTNRPSVVSSREMTLSLPSTGSYLQLLTAARQHLLFLLKQISPRSREATVELLNEKWDGNVLGDANSVAKRARGDWTGVLPGKTKRWKDFWGLEFRWILEECVGSGVVELFDTGSVGSAVRAR